MLYPLCRVHYNMYLSLAHVLALLLPPGADIASTADFAAVLARHPLPKRCATIGVTNEFTAIGSMITAYARLPSKQSNPCWCWRLGMDVLQ